MPADWTQNPYLGAVEGMNEQQFAEHVRRLSVRISRAAAAGNLDEVDRLALALARDAVNRTTAVGAPASVSYSLAQLAEWVKRPGLPE